MKFASVYWPIVAVLVTFIFFASNFAGPSGTPTYYQPTAGALVLCIAVYLIVLVILRRQKRP